jgi:hypothetical protein
MFYLQNNMRIIFIVVLFIFLSLKGIAQADSIDYNHGVPVNDDDTVQNFPEADFEPKTKLILVKPDQIPGSLKKALTRRSVYNGWDKFPVYLNETTGFYEIRVINAGDTTALAVDKKGNTVTFGKGTIDDL